MNRSAINLVFALSCMALPAFADKYFVVLKDKEIFAQAHQQIMAGVKSMSQLQIKTQAGVKTPFAAAGVQVEDSLKYLNSVIVEAETEEQIAALKKTGLVSFVEKEVFHPAPKPVQGYQLTKPWSFHLNYAGLQPEGGVGPKTPWGIHAVKAAAVWVKGNQGQYSRVLVLDTGIDKDHPALKDNFEKGRDFAGESENLPYPYADAEGHGTHCAGTIAAQMGSDGFVGVAPQAKILSGKVCGPQGCSNIAVAAGMNWAIQEKVDVVSMSLGGEMATGAEKRAAAALEAAGITVVAASGNNGTPKVSFPAAFPTVIAVGAVDIKLKKAKFSQWGPELDVVAPGVDVISSVPQGSGRESRVYVNGKVVVSNSFVGSPVIENPLTKSVVFAGLGRQGEFPPEVAGKFALISRGEIPFIEKVRNALAANAAGVVFFNNEPGLVQGAVTEDGSVLAIPVVMIEQVKGNQMKNALEIGSEVSVTVQTAATDYASFSGTSMATPHVAGVVALIKSANKNLRPSQVLEILKSSATIMEPNVENEHGSGLVDAERAVGIAAKPIY